MPDTSLNWFEGPTANIGLMEDYLRGAGFSGPVTKDTQMFGEGVNGQTPYLERGMSDELSQWLSDQGMSFRQAYGPQGGELIYGLFGQGGDLLNSTSQGFSNSGGWIAPVVMATLAAIGAGAGGAFGGVEGGVGGTAGASAAEQTAIESALAAEGGGGAAGGVGGVGGAAAGSPTASSYALQAQGGLSPGAAEAINSAASFNMTAPEIVAAGGGGAGAGEYLGAAKDSESANRALALDASATGVPSSIDLGSLGGSMSTGTTIGDILTQALQGFGFGGGGSGGGSIRDIFNVGSGLYGMSEARKARKRMSPFDQYREEYGRRLQELERNPGSITSTPGFQAGLKAVQRGQAASGYLGSGNELAALAQYGGNFFNNETARLAQLAGAGAAPGAGSDLYAALLGRSLASIGYGASPFLKRIGG
jgi:hypothetical protein